MSKSSAGNQTRRTFQSAGMANKDTDAQKEAPLRPITLEEELRRNPQLKEQDVALLRDWVYMQPHLPPVHDRELAMFLHLSNYSVERAKEITDTNFTMRTHIPEFFSRRDQKLTDLQNAANVTLYSVLPKSTPDGYRVMLHCVMNSDTTIFNFSDSLKLLTMVLDLWLLSGTSPGLVYVMDMKGLTLGHLARLDIVVCKKVLAGQNLFSRRVRGIHYINAVPFVDKVMAMIKPLMKKELRDMIQVHTENSETLFKYVPRDILPEEYGGTAPSVKTLHERMQSQLLANREYFLAEEQRAVDETKRPGRPRSAEDLFGVEGTFKKLDID